ncbi:hypothetical protein E2C01_022387 [Portunus trituberculatus]|uniref:Uncharacterized protein n=1 Tax=Portunus trituberculatus TaxID=210409 RepID=A0A5B7E758_PORTR|nr:hypothetical protein [Portunus trituberculatus]
MQLARSILIKTTSNINADQLKHGLEAFCQINSFPVLIKRYNIAVMRETEDRKRVDLTKSFFDLYPVQKSKKLDIIAKVEAGEKLHEVHSA